MKKLLIILSCISIGTSTVSVTGCTLVNYEKQYIANKITNLVNVSSTLLRSAVVNDSSGLDNDYLQSILLPSKAKDMNTAFGESKQTTMESLSKSYFKSSFNTESIKKLGENSNLTLGGKNANTSIDKVIDYGLIFLTAIKSSGGINTRLAGFLEGALPILANLIVKDGNVNLPIPDDILTNISKNAGSLAKAITFLSKSGLLKGIMDNFLNVPFLKAIENKEIGNIILSVITGLFKIFRNFREFENYINNEMFNDFPQREKLTNKDIQNSIVIRINNILVDLTGKGKIESNKYKNIVGDNDFLNNISDSALELIKNINDVKFLNIISHIDDLFFIIGGFLQIIGSIDFEDYTPTDSKHLYATNESNSVYLENLRNKPFESFSFNKVIKNLAIATSNVDNPNGIQMQKLLNLIIYSGGSDIEIKGKKWDFNSIYNLLVKIKGKEQGVQSPLGILITGLGNGLVGSLLDPKLAEGLKSLNPGYLITQVVDNITQNTNTSGLFPLIKSLSSSINLDYSQNNEKMVKPFSALYDEDSTLFKELLNLEINNKNFNLSNLFNATIMDGMTISDYLKKLYEEFSTYALNKETIQKSTDKIKEGIESICKLLTEKNIELKENDKIFKTGLSSLEAAMYTTQYKGLIYTSPNGVVLKGTKAAMYLLGYRQDSNTFESDSILGGAEKIFADENVKKIVNDAIDSLKLMQENKRNYINDNFKSYLSENNFIIDGIEHDGFENNNDEKINYNIIYTDPRTKKVTKYAVKIKQMNYMEAWELESILKIN